MGFFAKILEGGPIVVCGWIHDFSQAVLVKTTHLLYQCSSLLQKLCVILLMPGLVGKRNPTTPRRFRIDAAETWRVVGTFCYVPEYNAVGCRHVGRRWPLRPSFLTGLLVQLGRRPKGQRQLPESGYR